LRETVFTLADRLLGDLGDNLRSLSVVGSALTPDFHDRKSDINTVLVVGRRSQQVLRLLAEYQKTWAGRARLAAPFLWTEEYLLDSLDVFAVGMLDFQFNHDTVLGEDPFASLTFYRPYVRLQCERELKQLLVDLRQGYVRAAGDLRRVGRLLMDSVNTLLPLMRAILWLEGTERSPEASKTISVTARRFGLNVTAFEEPLRLRDDRATPQGQGVDAMFENVYRVIDYLSRQVDRMEVPA
jgi:hypothetical protein